MEAETRAEHIVRTRSGGGPGVSVRFRMEGDMVAAMGGNDG